MGTRYLDSLATVCRAAGLVVHEVDGWERRARGSGGYDSGRPTHLMAHHTASNPGSDPDGDVAYITSGSENSPIANLYLSRSGEVWVIAGGATNTNGSGSAPWPGGCPDDQMNTHAIGIEAANNGVGEPWPHAQQTAYVALCAALCAAYDIGADLVRAHHEWTSRKIDPAGQSMYASGSSSWQMPPFRDDVAAELQPVPVPPIPTPEPEEDVDMAFIIQNTQTGQVILIYGDGKTAGLAGADLAGYFARFGEPIPTDGAVCDSIIGKE